MKIQLIRQGRLLRSRVGDLEHPCDGSMDGPGGNRRSTGATLRGSQSEVAKCMIEEEPTPRHSHYIAVSAAFAAMIFGVT